MGSLGTGRGGIVSRRVVSSSFLGSGSHRCVPREFRVRVRVRGSGSSLSRGDLSLVTVYASGTSVVHLCQTHSVKTSFVTFFTTDQLRQLALCGHHRGPTALLLGLRRGRTTREWDRRPPRRAKPMSSQTGPEPVGEGMPVCLVWRPAHDGHHTKQKNKQNCFQEGRRGGQP